MRFPRPFAGTHLAEGTAQGDSLRHSQSTADRHNPSIENGRGLNEDVYDLGPRLGKCPRCGAILHEPEYTYDDDGVQYIEGPTGHWCPACGWEEES